MRETWVQSLGWEDPLEKGKATHSSALAWRSPRTAESMESQSRTWLSDFQLHSLFHLHQYLACLAPSSGLGLSFFGRMCGWKAVVWTQPSHFLCDHFLRPAQLSPVSKGATLAWWTQPQFQLPPPKGGDIDTHLLARVLGVTLALSPCLQGVLLLSHERLGRGGPSGGDMLMCLFVGLPILGVPLTSNTTQRSSMPSKRLQSALAQSALSEAKDVAPNFYRCPTSAGLRSLPLSLFHPTFFLTVRPNHLCLPSVPQGLCWQAAVLIPCVFSSVCRLGVYVFWWLSRVRLCDPVDWSPWNFPGQNTGVITFSFSMGSFQPRDGTQIYHTAGRFFINWAIREDQVVRGAMWESGA